MTPAWGAAPPRRGFGKHLALGHGRHNGTRGPCQRRAARGQVTPAPAGWKRGSQEPPCSPQRATSPQGAEGGQDLALLSPQQRARKPWVPSTSPWGGDEKQRLGEGRCLVPLQVVRGHLGNALGDVP